ncbi:hypothetical protein Glove_681g9 [Diversispora epigaea]|uniref:Uncharacterized protein n=1 Tax=Diversispora epigaea TaxID=1348612 RepID=A0A397G6T9_9GLOM|nr:hypothetical protein Glove_681g9 [Diversispora epigaea]
MKVFGTNNLRKYYVYVGVYLVENDNNHLKSLKTERKVQYKELEPKEQSLIKYQNTPDAPGVMTYLLSRDLSNWDSQDIPNPKMKTEKFYLPYNTTY